jgi:HlyD family secretion protein
VQVQGQGKSYLVKIRLTKSNELQFHTGMSCRAEIVTRGAGATAVTAVPVQAIQYEEAENRGEAAKSSIFVIVDGKAHKREVDPGVADDTYVAVTKGVEAGAQIVTGPSKVLRFLREGDRVSVKTADADARGEKSPVGKDSTDSAAKP